MLSENIKNLRKEKGMSQEELAERLGVVRQTVSKWEQNLSVPDSEMLIKIAEIFEVSVSSLLGETVEIKDTKSELAEISQRLENLNAMMAERNSRTRRILFRVVAVGLIIIAVIMCVCTVLTLTRLWFLISPSSSVGIIGGADGPTAILVNSSDPDWIALILSVVISVALIALSVLFFRKSKR